MTTKLICVRPFLLLALQAGYLKLFCFIELNNSRPFFISCFTLLPCQHKTLQKPFYCKKQKRTPTFSNIESTCCGTQLMTRFCSRKKQLDHRGAQRKPSYGSSILKKAKRTRSCHKQLVQSWLMQQVDQEESIRGKGKIRLHCGLALTDFQSVENEPKSSSTTYCPWSSFFMCLKKCYFTSSFMQTNT